MVRSVVIPCLVLGWLNAAPNGIQEVYSRYDVATTTKRLVQIVRKRGAQLFTVIDHADNAKSAELSIPDSRVVLFGDPKMETQLLKCSPSFALDLPQKMVVYEDNRERVHVLYNDTGYLFWRHQGKACSRLEPEIKKTLRTIAKEAAGVF